MMIIGMETLGEELLTIAAASLGYGLGSLNERRRSSKQKQTSLAEDMYLESQIELKRIQFAVNHIRSNAEFNAQLSRLRRFFQKHFELQELYPVNGAFCIKWLSPVCGVSWNDTAKVRFRDDVERLRAA